MRGLQHGTEELQFTTTINREREREKESDMAQASLKLALQHRIIVSLWSSCLHLLNTVTVGVLCYCTECWKSNLGASCTLGKHSTIRATSVGGHRNIFVKIVNCNGALNVGSVQRVQEH